MKRPIAALGVVCMLGMSSLMADHLKDRLSGMLNEKDDMPAMVNLNGLGMGTGRPAKPVSRPAKAVVATVNGKKVLKKEADAYLSERTKGKVNNFDLLPKKQRLALIKEMFLPLVLANEAKKGLSKGEADTVLSRLWMQKKSADMNVSDEAIAQVYEKIKAQAKAQSALAQVPPLEKIKERIKMQIAEQKIVKDLMRGVQIRVEPNSDSVAGYAGMMAISVDDVNKALQIMTKGKATWATLPEKDKARVLEMVAPRQMITLAANNELTKEQKENALTNYWMQKQLVNVTVSDDDVKKRYAKIKKRLAKSKKELPPFEKLAPALKLELAKEKLVSDLMKHAKIKLK